MDAIITVVKDYVFLVLAPTPTRFFSSNLTAASQSSLALAITKMLLQLDKDTPKKKKRASFSTGARLRAR